MRDSTVPSVTDFVPGTLGSVIDLLETVETYNRALDAATFHDVSGQGIKTPDDPFQDEEDLVGRAMGRAQDELEYIAAESRKVAERARSYSEGKGSENWRLILNALESEREQMERIGDVESWSNIDPELYNSNDDGPTVKAAEQVKESAEATLEVIDEFDAIIQNQASKVEEGEYMDFPKFIAGHNQNTEKIQDEASGFMFNRFAGDRYNLVIQNSEGEDKYRRWIDTSTDASLVEYKLEGDDAKADVKIEEEDFEELLTDSSVEKVTNMHYHGDIVVDGNGVFGGFKYGSVNVLTSIKRGIDGLIKKIGGLF